MTSQLIAHWPLANHTGDVKGRFQPAIASDVALGEVGPTGRSGTAAAFNGRSSVIELPLDANIELADRPFTFACWAKLSPNITTAYGEIFSQFHIERRCGVSLRISSSSPGYNGLSDVRQVHFGIDNAIDSPWIDHGKPWPSNTLVSTLTVFRGQLYTGIADAEGVHDSPSIFRFRGGRDWEFCGRLPTDPLTRSVQSMVVHKNRLYAGTGNWDWTRAKRGQCGNAELFVYDGGTSWHRCGLFPNAFRVSCLGSYNGMLYAGCDDGHVWCYDDELPEEQAWTDCGQMNGHNRANAMIPFRRQLYVAPHGACFSYSGQPGQWTHVGGLREKPKNKIGDPSFYGENQTHCLRVYDSALWAGLWPQGKVVKWESDGHWSDCGTLGIDPSHQINEVNELTVYSGKLYAGLLPLGEVYRHDQADRWKMLRRLVHNPDFRVEDPWSWSRVPCMTVFGGRLFAGTSSCHGRADVLTPGLTSLASEQCGRVHSFEAGRNACFDEDLVDGWHHITAVRDFTELRLYIDGRLAVTSRPYDERDFNAPSGVPLKIGQGPQNFFDGMLADVRVYNGVITPKELASISSTGNDPALRTIDQP
jgi:hypothetical protein